MHLRLVVTILGLLVTAEAVPDLGHGDHAAHNNAILDSGLVPYFRQNCIILIPESPTLVLLMNVLKIA